MIAIIFSKIPTVLLIKSSCTLFLGGIMIGLETQPFYAYMLHEFMNAHILLSLPEKPK